MLIEGPAGIGKSGLLGGLRDGTAHGLRVLAARAGELEREFAYGVVRQLFEAEVAGTSGPFEGAAAPAAAVFAAAPDAGEGDASFAALHGLFWLTLNLAADRPLLLAIDDLHWCDRPSLRFLAYLARRLDGVPALVATTLRTGEPPADAALLGEITSDPAALTLRPGPLSLAAVDELVRERLGAGAEPEFCAACHEATGGNPLLVRQLIRALEGEGVQPRAGSAGVVRAIGPRAVSSTVLLRLARLSEDARAVARAAAVLGESAALGPVAALAGRDERAAAAATGELIRAEILRPDPPLGFVHPLVRDAVYHELPMPERELEHERAAHALRDAGADDEHVAAQLLLAPRRGAPWVSELLRRAGDASVRKGAAESAVAYLRRALDEPPPAERRTEFLIALGTVEAVTSGPAAAEHLQEAHDALDDPLARGELAILLFRSLLFTGRSAEAAAVAERADAELAEEHGDLRRALEALALATYFFGSDERLLAGIAAHRHPPEEPGPGAKALAAVAAYDWANRDGTAEQCAQLALAALAGGELHATGNGLIVIIATVALVLADRPEALESLALLEAGAHRRGSLLDSFSVQLWMGFALWHHGELDEAVEQLHAAFTGFATYGLASRPRAYADGILATSSSTAATFRARARARAQRRRGRRVRRGALLAVRRPRPAGRRAALGGRARRHGRLRAPVRRVPRLAHHAVAAIRADALDRLGRADEAVALAEEELAVARTWGAPGRSAAR